MNCFTPFTGSDVGGLCEFVGTIAQERWTRTPSLLELFPGVMSLSADAETASRPAAESGDKSEPDDKADKGAKQESEQGSSLDFSRLQPACSVVVSTLMTTEGSSHEELLPQPASQAQLTSSVPREEKGKMDVDCAEEAEEDAKNISDEKESHDRNRTDEAETMDTEKTP